MFTLPKLGYDYKALEPHIDAATMEIHHTKHHQAYIDKLNAAVSGGLLETTPIEEILAEVSKHSMAVRNHGGGHFNHSLFWTLLSPDGGQPAGALLEKINETFASLDGFKKAFGEAAMAQFGSGWAWLVVQDGELTISTTPNQDNPLMDVSTVRGTPILGLDVWEHAYYLRHQNKRADYIEAFWNVVNWTEVHNLYTKALG